MKHLRRRLGANGPGLTVAVIALVIALAGGAYAASGALTGKQKKEVTKIAKKYAGKAGAQGPAGPAGPAGAKGDSGSQGSEGKEGKAGTNGVSVTSTESLGPIPGHCPEGGSTFESTSGKTYACNGAEGPEGPPGAPWPGGGVLAPNAVETGAWAFTGTTADTNGIRVPLSFPVRMPIELLENSVHFQGEANFGDSCEGGVIIPKPKPGQLCVYVNSQEPVEGTTLQGIYPVHAAVGIEKGADYSGAMLVFSAPTGPASGSGSFAIQGCVPAPNEVECATP